MYEFRYGGKDGAVQTLAISGDMIVVRSRGRKPPHSVGRVRSRDLIASLAPVTDFPNAQVEVLRLHTAARANSLESLLDELKDDHAFEFAGQCLVDEISQKPVVYTENLFLSLRDDVPQDFIAQLANRHGLHIKRPLTYAPNAYFLACPDNIGRNVFDLSMILLKNYPEVRYCHPEVIRKRREKAIFPMQWHLRETVANGRRVDAHVSVEGAWETTTGANTTIALIDDGVDIDHVEFRARGGIVSPRDATRHSNDPRPKRFDDNHGTACAGVACASGVDGASGVAPDARLMPIRLVSGLGSQDEADALVWAARHGADVISCSWGPEDGDWDDPNDPLHRQPFALPDSTRLAIEFAASEGRNGRGCVICWAAGNGNEPVDNDGYASSPDVIAVGACNDRSRRSAYSDFGDALWCMFPSDDVVPSLTTGIWTTDRLGRNGYNPGDDALGHASGNYTNNFGGTSSACPGVAGVAALILAKAAALTPGEVRDVLRDTCEKIDSANAAYDGGGHSTLYGYGRVNAAAATDAV